MLILLYVFKNTKKKDLEKSLKSKYLTQTYEMYFIFFMYKVHVVWLVFSQVRVKYFDLREFSRSFCQYFLFFSSMYIHVIEVEQAKSFYLCENIDKPRFLPTYFTYLLFIPFFWLRQKRCLKKHTQKLQNQKNKKYNFYSVFTFCFY